VVGDGKGTIENACWRISPHRWNAFHSPQARGRRVVLGYASAPVRVPTLAA